jgi:hypothetical protein
MTVFKNSYFSITCQIGMVLAIEQGTGLSGLISVKISDMRYSQVSPAEQERELEGFESVTEEEIILLWRSIRANGLSEDEAWHAIVTGIALDLAFARSRTVKTVEH